MVWWPNNSTSSLDQEPISTSTITSPQLRRGPDSVADRRSFHIGPLIEWFKQAIASITPKRSSQNYKMTLEMIQKGLHHWKNPEESIKNLKCAVNIFVESHRNPPGLLRMDQCCKETEKNLQRNVQSRHCFKESQSRLKRIFDSLKANAETTQMIHEESQPDGWCSNIASKNVKECTTIAKNLKIMVKNMEELQTTKNLKIVVRNPPDNGTK